MNRIPEDFLQYIWRYRLMDEKQLALADGTPVRIVDQGTLNRDSGPDFFNARIIIGNTTWAGNVEVHVHASDWLRHNHQEDEAYNSVILHAVRFNDCQITRKDGEQVPTVVIRFHPRLLEKYQGWLTSARWVPCQDEVHKIHPVHLRQWLTSLEVERLAARTSPLKEQLDKSGGDWDQLLHHLLAHCFGLPLNSLPFSLLSDSVRINTLLPLRNDPFALEALLFGKAGFLDSLLPEDPYMAGLVGEYNRLRQRHSGQPVPQHLWKFMRLRPSSFPTVRIAQFASLIHEHYPLTGKIKDCSSVKELMALFRVRAGDYWNTRYRFGKEASYQPKYTGRDFTGTLIINAIAPFLFLYGKARGEEKYSDRALALLEELPAEKNALIKKWITFGIVPDNAFESQALLQLHQQYCLRKDCLSCRIGIKLISGTSDEGTQPQVGLPGT
ncbi:MAG: DUF2851 family protein [Bacteroidota bacterium]